MNSEDTIVAVATAHGVGAISIVRLSGSKSLKIAQKITKKTYFTPRNAHLSPLYMNDGALIDQAIVIYFKAPFSFTGEDIVEFQCHGGIVIAETLLRLAQEYGARLAYGGEFSKRAFLNGKIDLSKAEAIAKIIESKSLLGTKILARQLGGELFDYIEKMRSGLVGLLAHAEVMIDYAEEDLDDNLLLELQEKLQRYRQELHRLLEISQKRRGIFEGFRITIVGKPNVGKSSLLNALLSFERAIVTDIAGTTRDTIEEQIRIGSHIVKIVDTAGIRQSEDSVEQIGIKRSLQAIDHSDIVIALFDAGRPWQEEDEEIRALIESVKDSKEVIVALNKSDLPKQLDVTNLQRFKPIEISAKKEYSLLLDRLESILDSMGGDEELLLVSSRQMESVEQACKSIDEAVVPLQEGALEFFSYHIQEATKALSKITRPYENDEILDKMFSEFCLGK